MWHPLVAELLIDAREAELTLATRHHHDPAALRGPAPARSDLHAAPGLPLRQRISPATTPRKQSTRARSV
jgi:hypothetical protein